MDGLWFLLFAGIAIAAAAGSYHFKHQRRQALQAFAAKHGFAYTAHAPQGLLGMGFPLFYEGDGRGAENGLIGTWRDMSFRAADFWYYEESTRDAQGRRGARRYRRFSVAAVELPIWVPDIEIARESLLTAVADRLGMVDIDFESEEFNKTFEIKTKDRKFAFELIDPRMMGWLLSCDRRFAFQLHGKGVLIYSKRLQPKELFPLIGSLEQFCDRIPRLVLRTYAYEPREEAR